LHFLLPKPAPAATIFTSLTRPPSSEVLPLRTTLLFLLTTVALIRTTPSLAADPAPLLAKIKAVGKEGAGNVEAARAWKELVKLGPAVLLDTLAALDDADPTAANWLRSAVDTIADREIAGSRPLPARRLEAFVKDTRHGGSSRRLAYEWLVRVDASAPGRLLPTMLQDPGQELRRDAVAVVLAEAQKQLDKGDKVAATGTYKKALSAARDKDQVDLVAQQLKKLNVAVDLAKHFGFVRHWMVAGPFDNRGGKGFAVAYPPEQRIAASYTGKEGAKFGWKCITTDDPYGKVDLNKEIGKHMGAVGYALAWVYVGREQPVEVRVASNNAVKLFLNGKQIFFCEEYHHGMRMDQYVGHGTLKEGGNEILLKVCQNEQKDSWAQSWSFQLRLCDTIGGAVPVKNEFLKLENEK
jgi:hypothetical protein